MTCPSSPQVKIHVLYASHGDQPTQKETKFFKQLTDIIRLQWNQLKINDKAKLIIHETPTSLRNPREKSHCASSGRDSTSVAQPNYPDQLNSNWLLDVISKLFSIDDGDSAPENKESNAKATQELPLFFVSNPKNGIQLESIRDAMKTLTESLSTRGGFAHFTLTGTPKNSNLSFPLKANLNQIPTRNQLGRFDSEALKTETYETMPRLNDTNSSLISRYIKNLLLNMANRINSRQRIDILPTIPERDYSFEEMKDFKPPTFVLNGNLAATIGSSKAVKGVRNIHQTNLARPRQEITEYITNQRLALIRSQISSGELSPMQAYNLHLPTTVHLGKAGKRELGTLTKFLPRVEDLNLLRELVKAPSPYEEQASARALALALAYNPAETKLGYVFEDPTTLNRILNHISTKKKKPCEAFTEDYESFAKLVTTKAISPLVAVNIIADYNQSVARITNLSPDQTTANNLNSIQNNSFTGELSLEDKAQILGLAMTRLANNRTVALEEIITSLQAIKTSANTSTITANGDPGQEIIRLFTQVIPAKIQPYPVAEGETKPTITNSKPITTSPTQTISLTQPKQAVIRTRSSGWIPNPDEVTEIKETVTKQREENSVTLRDFQTICQSLTKETITQADAERIQRASQIVIGDKIPRRKKAPSSTRIVDTTNFEQTKRESVDRIRMALSRFRKGMQPLLLKDLFFAHLQTNQSFLNRKQLVEYRHKFNIEVADVPRKTTIINNQETVSDDKNAESNPSIKARIAKERRTRLETRRNAIEGLYRLSTEEETKMLKKLTTYTERWRKQYSSLNIRDLTVIYIALTDRVPDETKIRDITEKYNINIDKDDTTKINEYLAVAEKGLDRLLE